MKKLYMMLAAIFIACTSFSASAIGWWISGAFNNWEHATLELKHNLGDVNEYSVCIESLSGEFLICYGTDWANKIGTNGQKVVAGEYYHFVNGAGNFVMDGTVKNATIYLNTSSRTILVSGQSEENEYSEVYLIGDINGGGWNENITSFPLTPKADAPNVYEGIYTFTGDTNYFKLKAGSYVYGTDEDSDIEIESPFGYNARQGGAGAFVVGPGVYSFIYELDKNADTGRLSVLAIPQENTFETVYLIGEFNGDSWDSNLTCYPLKPKNGTTDVYEGTYAFTGDSNYFKIRANDYRYGFDHDIEIEYDSSYRAFPGGPGAYGFGEGEYTFSFTYDKNATEGKITVYKGTGAADTIDAADGEAAYYTLQGVRVAEPTDGLYIKIANGKATKINIRK